MNTEYRFLTSRRYLDGAVDLLWCGVEVTRPLHAEEGAVYDEIAVPWVHLHTLHIQIFKRFLLSISYANLQIYFLFFYFFSAAAKGKAFHNSICQTWQKLFKKINKGLEVFDLSIAHTSFKRPQQHPAASVYVCFQTLTASVPDPWHFGTDPDPQICHLTNGSGSGSCSFRRWSSSCKQTITTFWR